MDQIREIEEKNKHELDEVRSFNYDICEVKVHAAVCFSFPHIYYISMYDILNSSNSHKT